MWFYFVLLVFAAFEGGRMYVDPDTLYQLGFLDKKPPYCRPLKEDELASRNIGPDGFMASYIGRGKEESCEVAIFREKERPSFVDFVTDHISVCTERMLQGVKAISPDFSSFQSQAVFIDTRGIEDRDLAVFVQDAFSSSLLKTMGESIQGKGSVIRSLGEQGDTFVLEVQLRQVLDPTYLCAMRVAKFKDGKQIQGWNTL
ncbi:MAG: hypothetical protein KA436_06980 [Oligoflexales bacterium]|nr:hypothetical protein [Oligoflexales bacterium]